MAKAWLDKRADKKEKQQLRDDIEKLAGLMSPEVIKAHVEEAVRQAVAARAVSPTADEIVDLELFIEDVPTALRKALARPDDPSGTTVPYHFRLDTPDDVAKVFPPPPLGFRPGVALPGLPGWVMVRKLGRGGFGEVWLARHTKFSSLVGAVKFFPGEAGRALVHEAELIDRVKSAGQHTNLVPLINVDLDGAIPWIMFEFVDGQTLAEWVRTLDGKPAAERLALVLNAFAQICDGVAFLHDKAKVVHGDLKPANVLVCGATGTCRITDLGIGAVAAEANDGMTRGGRRPTSMHGARTPIYTSPQQQKPGHTLDPRDDVHALGVIAFQLVTGQLAAGPGSDAEDDLADAGAPAGLFALVKACTATKPERRPKNAAEVLEKLKALGRSQSPEPVSPTRERGPNHPSESGGAPPIEPPVSPTRERGPSHLSAQADGPRSRVGLTGSGNDVVPPVAVQPPLPVAKRVPAAPRPNTPPADPKPGERFTLNVSIPEPAIKPGKLMTLTWKAVT